MVTARMLMTTTIMMRMIEQITVTIVITTVVLMMIKRIVTMTTTIMTIISITNNCISQVFWSVPGT